MKQQDRIKYIPPLLLDHVELETESPILTGSGGGVDPFQNGWAMTNGQNYEEIEYNLSEFNHDWN